MPVAPQAFPYQGSKRRLAPRLLRLLPADTAVLREGCAGSAALSLAWRQRGGGAVQLVDSLPSLVQLWREILARPEQLAAAYADLWHAAESDPRAHYLQVREAFNAEPQPARLLYLLGRCVKAAVRFNRQGEFNQAADHRRRGARPVTVRRRLLRVQALLGERASLRCGDWQLALDAAGARDVVFLDPPYEGVSGARDRRYHQGLDRPRLERALAGAAAKGLSVLLTLDGRRGGRVYAAPWPRDLGYRQVNLPAGRSAQATLAGRSERTVERAWLSPALVGRLGATGPPASPGSPS